MMKRPIPYLLILQFSGISSPRLAAGEYPTPLELLKKSRDEIDRLLKEDEKLGTPSEAGQVLEAPERKDFSPPRQERLRRLSRWLGEITRDRTWGYDGWWPGSLPRMPIRTGRGTTMGLNLQGDSEGGAIVQRAKAEIEEQRKESGVLPGWAEDLDRAQRLLCEVRLEVEDDGRNYIWIPLYGLENRTFGRFEVPTTAEERERARRPLSQRPIVLWIFGLLTAGILMMVSRKLRRKS